MINLEILFIVDSRETLNACFNVVRCLTQILNTIYSTCIVTNSGIFIYLFFILRFSVISVKNAIFTLLDDVLKVNSINLSTVYLQEM